MSSFYEDSNLTMGPTLMTSSDPVHLTKDSLKVLGNAASTYACFWRRGHTQPVTVCVCNRVDYLHDSRAVPSSLLGCHVSIVPAASVVTGVT